jgi:hypothetical protein
MRRNITRPKSSKPGPVACFISELKLSFSTLFFHGSLPKETKHHYCRRPLGPSRADQVLQPAALADSLLFLLNPIDTTKEMILRSHQLPLGRRRSSKNAMSNASLVAPRQRRSGGCFHSDERQKCPRCHVPLWRKPLHQEQMWLSHHMMH